MGEYEPIKTIKLGDRQYDLVPRHCAQCNKDHLEVWRWCGSSFSRYFFPSQYDQDDLVNFVKQIDEKLLQNSAQLLRDFKHHLDFVNSNAGIEADNTFAFLLLEYARQRISELQKLGALDALLSEDDSDNERDRALRLAFELGSAAAEHRVFDSYEEYFWEGIALAEGRETGRLKARAERLRQGEKTRNAILKAAQELYAKRPDLLRNDTETAREIRQMKLPALEKAPGHWLGIDSITKCLRQARKHPFHQEKE
jgi:hypothetical protein